MRLECRKEDATTKWYEINLVPIDGDNFVVVMSYGTVGPNGEDAILCPLYKVFSGPWLEAQEKLIDKLEDREKIGYQKVEPKTDK